MYVAPFFFCPQHSINTLFCRVTVASAYQPREEPQDLHLWMLLNPLYCFSANNAKVELSSVKDKQQHK